jgi:hypothetical protein
MAVRRVVLQRRESASNLRRDVRRYDTNVAEPIELVANDPVTPLDLDRVATVLRSAEGRRLLVAILEEELHRRGGLRFRAVT